MKEFTSEELKEILEKHDKYLRFEQGGEIADLSGADLSGADLRGVVGDAIYIKSIFLDAYPITYTSGIL